MRRQTSAKAVAWVLVATSACGCGGPGEEHFGPRMEQGSSQDPIWREYWVPIDHAERERNPSVQVVWNLVPPCPGRVIADIGAGGGFFAFRWAQAVGPTGFIYAVDIDQRMTRKLSYERASRGGWQHGRDPRAGGPAWA